MFVCQYMCTTAASCWLLFSLHFLCSATWKACASLCAELGVKCRYSCMSWGGCKGVRGSLGCG